MNAEQIHNFNTAADSYLENACLQNQINQHLQSLLPELKDNALVLDCGSHAHNLCARLPRQTVISVDTAISALQQNKNPNCLAADFSELPFADNTFDLIFSSMALHWADDITTTLNHWQNLLKPRGKIALAIPIKGSCNELFDAMGKTLFSFPKQDELKKVCHDIFGDITLEGQRFTHNFDSIFSLLRYFQQTGCQLKSKGLFKINRLQENYQKTNNTYPLSYYVDFLVLSNV